MITQELQDKINELAEKVTEARRWWYEKHDDIEPCLLVDNEGRLVDLLFGATLHDWVVWRVKEWEPKHNIVI